MPEGITFEIGGRYRNRLGWYKVLEISGDRIRVSYEKDGHEDILSIGIQKRIIDNISQEEERVSPIAENREKFFFYVNECNEYYRFGHDLRLYREIIDMHRCSSDLDSLLNDKNFCIKIFNTLEAWNMNQRGARLMSLENFTDSILAQRSNLTKLYQYKLSSIKKDLIDRELQKLMEDVFLNLKVMRSKRKIVGVSKAMHFLLPDLVIPIDGTYTMLYFYGYNKYSSNAQDEFDTFKDIFVQTYEIAKRLELTQDDVNNKGWNTSIPKLIDNAIIGFFKHYEKSKNA